jgi:hypothetical protein
VRLFLNKVSFNNPRWWVFSRITAAMLGGYALATSSSIVLGQLLGNIVGHYQAIHIGLMLTFLVYACAVMWVFSVTSAKGAWFGLLQVNIIFAALAWLLMNFTGVNH